MVLSTLKKSSSRSDAYIFLGATATGKSSLAFQFAQKNDGEIINCDMAQCYVPLTIGTAKPSIHERAILEHHLFDLYDAPVLQSSFSHAKKIEQKIDDTIARGKVPIIVGGSTLYNYCLFYKQVYSHFDSALAAKATEIAKLHGTTWYTLSLIDRTRAEQISPADSYRLERAIKLASQGFMPSCQQLQFKPKYNYTVFLIEREVTALKDRISQRVAEMLDAGFLDEVAHLNASWKNFVLQRKIIGYPEAISFLAHFDKRNLHELSDQISHSTFCYAKKQRKFFKMMHQKITKEIAFCNLVTWQNINI